MKIKKSIILETMNKYIDIILDQILKECQCGCKDEEPKKDLHLIIDDDDNEEEIEDQDDNEEELDEQSNLAAAARNPEIVKLAHKIMRQFGGKLDFRAALIRAERFYGKTGAMI